jgi:hypothetical protein
MATTAETRAAIYIPRRLYPGDASLAWTYSRIDRRQKQDRRLGSLPYNRPCLIAYILAAVQVPVYIVYKFHDSAYSRIEMETVLNIACHLFDSLMALAMDSPQVPFEQCISSSSGGCKT